MKPLHLILIIVLVGGVYFNVGGSRDWLENLSTTPVTPPTATQPAPGGGSLPGASPGGTPSASTGIPYGVRARVVWTNGSAVTQGQTIQIYVPDSTGKLIMQGSENTDADGFIDSVQVKEGETFYICAAYNSTSLLQDQWWGALTMPYAADSVPAGWNNNYLPIAESPLVVRVPPTQNTDVDIAVYMSDGTAVGQSDAATSRLSKTTANSYLSADETFTVSFFVKQDWTAFGGSWYQPETNQGHDATDYTSVIRISLNATTGYVWKSGGWNTVGGQSTTKNMTKQIPMLEAFDENPIRYDETVKINFASSADDTGYIIKVDWIDAQDWETIKAGSETIRVAPNTGYTYLKSEKFYLLIKA